MGKPENFSRSTRPSVAGMVEDVVGCKWSMTVLGLVVDGIRRPGAMEHTVPGLSARPARPHSAPLDLDTPGFTGEPPRAACWV